MNLKSKWSKTCPTCGKEQSYSCKSVLTISIKQNRTCNSCRADKFKTRPSSEQWKRICSCCKCEMIYTSAKSYLFCVRHNTKCRQCATIESSKYVDRTIFQSQDYKNKMSSMFREKRKSESYGEEFKRKCRENKLKQIRSQGTKYTYNPTACEFINNLNKERGWNLQHALNGGEVLVCGYSLDGYDKNRNIVFEYDEPKHRIISVKEKDKKRQERIISAIHPSEFWRYDEKDNKMIEVITNKEVICPPH